MTGVDVNAGMLTVAARESSGLPAAVEWRQAPADRLPFGDGEFDAVVCQQGLQFFPDVAAATTEAARVSRPGARVAVTVWSPLERSPYFEAQFLAIRQIVGAQAVTSFEGAFGFPADRITGALSAAGLRDVRVHEVTVEIRPPRLAEYAVGHLQALPWGAVVARTRTDGLEAVGALMVERLAPHMAADGSVAAPFASLLVSAAR